MIQERQFPRQGETPRARMWQHCVASYRARRDAARAPALQEMLGKVAQTCAGREVLRSGTSGARAQVCRVARGSARVGATQETELTAPSPKKALF